MGVVGGWPRCESGRAGRRLRAMTRLRLALLVTATGGSIALFVAVAHPGRLLASLGALPASSVASAVAATMAGVMLVAFRWRLLLGTRSIEAPIARLFAALTIGAAVNNVVPARAGDAVRVESAHRLTGASRLAIAGSLLSERIFDAFVLAVLVMVGALSTGSTGGFLWLGLGLGAAIAAGGAVASRFVSVGGLRSVAAVLGTTFAIWFADVVMYGALARGFDLHISFGALLLLVGVGNLALAIPGTAAGVGSFELVTLAGAHGIGVGGPSLAAFVLAVHAAIVLPTTVTGFAFSRWALPRREVRVTEPQLSRVPHSPAA